MHLIEPTSPVCRNLIHHVRLPHGFLMEGLLDSHDIIPDRIVVDQLVGVRIQQVPVL